MAKSSTRQELANVAGVTRNTINTWLEPFMPQLIAMGLRKRQRVFTPKMTAFICEVLAIDLDNKDGT